MSSWFDGFRPGHLVEITALAVTYIIGARIGQVFAIDPGNITPFWFPSGIIFAWVFLRGYHVWPGIFIGAYLGNTWAYADYSAAGSFLETVLAGGLNGIGDVLCAVGAVYFYRRRADNFNPVTQLRPFLVFLFVAAFLGPLASALLGISGLYAGGFLPPENVRVAFITWLVGDMTGVLLISPLILINFDDASGIRKPVSVYERLLYILIIFLLSLVYIGFPDIQPFGSQVEYFMLPLLLWATMRFNLKVAFITAFFFSFILIISHTAGYSAFPADQALNSVLALQFFIILTISSIFIIGLMIQEREKALAIIDEFNQFDVLTGVYKKKHFRKLLGAEIKRQLRNNQQFSLILLSADMTGPEREHGGPEAGEKHLPALVRLVRGLIQDIDVLARWGNRRFIILLPGMGRDDAVGTAEQIRDGVGGMHFAGGNIAVRLAVSAFPRGGEKEVVLKALDEALDVCAANTVAVVDDNPPA